MYAYSPNIHARSSNIYARTHKNWYIYYIYYFRRNIYNDIPASTSVFFVLGKKYPSGRAVPSGYFSPRTKNNLGVGAISLCIALQHLIYTLHIYQRTTRVSPALRDQGFFCVFGGGGMRQGENNIMWNDRVQDQNSHEHNLELVMPHYRSEGHW